MNLIQNSYNELSREELLAVVERRETTLKKLQDLTEEFICASFEFCDKRGELVKLIAIIDREVYAINNGSK